MVNEKTAEEGQAERFNRLVSELGLAGEPAESLDRVMSKLDLTKRVEVKDRRDEKP